MTMQHIGPERDAELGAALRAALDDGGDALFAARVRGAIVATPRGGTWEVLALWLRPGAAAAAALLLGLLATWAATARDTAVAAPLAEQLLAAEGVPSDDVVMTRMWEGR
ncbi:MAG TPA: hypothetical protein VFX50_02310 [Gemmatimonadales bacterium]|nr:hypothetical protein [Gemmatimonadales bacterium]